MANPNADKRIVIIGAGVSGIVTAKFLLLDGFRNITLLESYPHPGGVWARGRAYPRLSSNSIRGNYSLSDANLYREGGKGHWVYGDEICEGVEEYAKKWNVLPLIKFNTTVNSISEVPSATGLTWKVDCTDNISKQPSTMAADHLVVCTGLFSRPNIPRGIPGQQPSDPNAFKGLQLHSSDVAKGDNVEKLLKCKDIAIIGYGKSSLDLAEWLGLERRQKRLAGVPESDLPNIHLVFRQPHWFVPMQFFASMDFMKRASAAGAWWRPIWKPAPSASAGVRSASSLEREKMLGKKVAIEEAIRLGHGLPKGHCLVPKHPFAVDSSLGVASEHFFPLVLSNDITPHPISSIDRLSPSSIDVKPLQQLGGSTLSSIPCDAIIYGTGFHFSYPFISEALQKKMGIPRDNLEGAPTFFRTILPTAYRENGEVVFNGVFNSSSCACDIEVAAHWISELFIQGGAKAGDEGRGILKLPNAKEMDEQTAKFNALDKIFENGGGAKEGKVHVFGRYIDFADDMIMDLGLNTVRNGKTREEDWDKVYLAKSWAGLLEERKAKRDELKTKLAENARL